MGGAERRSPMKSKATGQGRDGIPAWAAWCSLLMGAVSLLIGLGFGVRSVGLWFGTVRTTGTIVGQERQPGPEGGYIPVVAYEVDGSSYRCKGAVGSNPASFTIGQSIAVRYRAAQPSLGYVDTFFDRWLIPLAFGGVGLFFAGFGYAALTRDGTPAKRGS